MMTTAIGLMSGTSLDGVDVALITTDGERVSAFGPSGYRAYSEAERNLLRRALAEAVHLTDRTARPGVLAEAERVVTHAHVAAIESFLADNAIASNTVDVIGFHGQTVLHRPAQRLTVQIGDAGAIARTFAVPLVHDFRAADVAAGGQGAPLVPAFHRALARSLAGGGPVVIVNIGGVSNITYIDGDDVLIACDTGPGNALLDDLMLRATGQPYDDAGRLAATGKADERWIAQAMQRPFFAAPPPKSLDRNEFADLVLGDVTAENGAATLTAFTAASIAAIVRHLPKPPQTWIVAGGGARNPTMLKMLQDRVAPARVETAAAHGWSSDAMEAQAFAFLAVRALKGLPLSYPATTGVPVPMTGGMVVRF